MTKMILFNKGNKYTKGGATMDIVALQDIVVTEKEKDNLPWLQLFNCGYRVTNDTIDWSTWNGCVYSDIDSKHYYNECRKFDADKLMKGLNHYLLINYNYNYLGMQTSNSGTGYHILFYFDVEKNEENFKKCEQRVREIMKETFTNIGAREIYEWKKVADKCSSSPLQGMYLTNKEWCWGNYNQPGFGSFEDIETYELDNERVKVSDVQDDGTELFKLQSVNLVNKVGYKNHHQRWGIFESLIAVFKEKNKVLAEWDKIVKILPEQNGHSHDFYLYEPIKNSWYERYNGGYVKVSRLEEFGYKFKKTFTPKQLELYKPDVVYELNANQHLTDIDIDWDMNRINHVFAGCGFGKTFMAKEFTNTGKRVCFISPMTSINKDSFDRDDANHWLIVDSINKDVVEHVQESVKNAMTSNWSICTTWDSFYFYKMWKYDFDYFVFDEIHSLYMYDYRIESIADIKDAIRRIKKGIKIMMTGTPSYEVEEFDCKKIQVNKPIKKVNAEIVFYEKSGKGYVYKDIKKWINQSADNIALIFRDQTNYKTEEDLKYYGIECDVFNKQYSETVGYIINNQTIRKQVTAFSVYGQTGINLYVDVDKKVRVYIMNDNSLGIIQYANRVRNKDVIDKVVIPFKNSKIDNDEKYLNTRIDYESAKRKVDMINSNRVQFDIISIKNKRMFEVKYGVNPDCLDKFDGCYFLNKERYASFRMIKNVQRYESQIQLIYNRLASNYFDVDCIYLDKDIPLAKHSKLRTDRFAGQMVRFDWGMVQETKERELWLKTTESFNKVVTGDLKTVIEDIINRIYHSNEMDIDQTRKTFSDVIQEMIRRNKTVSKKDIVRYDEFLKIESEFNQYIDNEFLVNMCREDWDSIKESARYTRTLYNESIDWKVVAKEVYGNLVKLKKIVSDNEGVFLNHDKDVEKVTVEDDAIEVMIEDYLRKEFAHRKKKGLGVVVEGVRYSSIDDAVAKTGLSRTTLWRRLKRQLQVGVGVS